MDPTLERSFRGHSAEINSVAFDPNLKQLVSGSSDASVMCWNFKPNLRAFRFMGHKAGVLSVAVSPSGKLVASGKDAEPPARFPWGLVRRQNWDRISIHIH